MADKYIRKQDVVDTINTNADGLEQNGGIPYAQGARAMAIVVEQMPPADVAPVRHARWVNGCCDRCGEHALYWSMASTYHESDFCPYCGAKMDG